MSDETHTGRKVVVVSLKNRIIEMTSQAKSCRDAYEGDYMRVPLGFMADALRDAAQVLQSRLDTVIGKRDQLSMEPADAVKSEALKANPHFTQTPAPEGIAWQPIASAPKDGTQIWLWWDGKRRLAHWHEAINPPSIGGRFANWLTDDKGSVSAVTKPTHWMPLPLPPDAPEGIEQDKNDEENDHSASAPVRSAASSADAGTEPLPNKDNHAKERP